MSIFNYIKNALFSGKEPVNVQEVLKRSSRFQQRYDEWLGKGGYNEFFSLLSGHLNHLPETSRDSLEIDFYNSKYSNGFVIYNKGGFGSEDFQFLMDHTRDRTLTMGYRVANSDRRITEKGNIIETIEKHYMKPHMQGDIPAGQLFGNILIELIIQDKIPTHLKVMANIYSDRNFKDPLPFRNYLEKLIENRN